MSSNSGRTPRKKKKRSALTAPFYFVIICFAMLVGMSVFFKVSRIEVTGAGIYSVEEIITASGIEEGDNLFFVNRFSAMSRISSKLPYVENVAINRYLPNRIVIEITESQALAYIVVEEEYWIIDRGCKALAKTDEITAENLIEITGLMPNSPDVGQTITAEESESAKIIFLSAILREIKTREMQGNISSIDISNMINPTFDYLERFQVKLGRNENLSYKFDILQSAVQELSSGDIGTIDLSIDNKAHFSPN